VALGREVHLPGERLDRGGQASSLGGEDSVIGHGVRVTDDQCAALVRFNVQNRKFVVWSRISFRCWA